MTGFSSQFRSKLLLALMLPALCVACSGKEDSSGNKAVAGGKTATSTPSKPEPVAPPPKTPFDLAREKAEVSNTVADWQAFAEMLQADDTRRGAAPDVWKRVLRIEPENAAAHAALGHVLFDPAWLKTVLSDSTVEDDTKSELEMARDDILANRLEGKERRAWLGASMEEAKEWNRWMGKAEAQRAAAKARASDPFVRDAESMGRSMMEELDEGLPAIDFRRRGITGDAFHLHTAKPYLLLVQRDTTGMEQKIGAEWSDVLLSLQATFYPMLAEGTGAHAPRGPIPVIILRDNAEYTKYQRRNDNSAPVTSGGHYEPWSNRLVVYRSKTEQERETLFHEGTHQLVEAAMKTAGTDKGMRQAFWFSEGIADYFGGHSREWDGAEKRWRFIPGTINPERIDTLVKSKERGNLFTLAELLEYRRIHYVQDKNNPRLSDKVLNGYAQGWGLCFLLANWKEGKYRPDFIRYVRDEFEGKSGKAAFEAVFNKVGLAELEKEFLAMIDELGKAKKDGRIVDGKLRPASK